MPELFLILQAVNLFWVIGLTVVVWLRKPGLDAKAAVSKIETEFARALESHCEKTETELRDHALKIVKIEAHMGHMPSKEHMEKLAGVVAKIDERTEGLMESITGVRESLASVQRYLLEHKG